MLNPIKRALARLLAKHGYQLLRAPGTGGEPYEPIAPLATYAPWQSDPDFVKTFEAIRLNTLVDLYRAWELWSLTEQVRGVEGGMLEVGVWRGGTGALLCNKATLLGIEDPVYLCDTFEGVVHAGPKDPGYKGGEHADTSIDEVRRLLARLSLGNAQILQGIFPEETSSRIPATMSFRLCHIDVDVYQSAKDTFCWVWPRLVTGGIVVFDDYGFFGCQGIAELVDQEIRPLPDAIVVHNLNGHAVVIKVPR
jgi:O-methyltransferase